jgi:hypothetical protein
VQRTGSDFPAEVDSALLRASVLAQNFRRSMHTEFGPKNDQLWKKSAQFE